jgi:hypothetical protein
MWRMMKQYDFFLLYHSSLEFVHLFQTVWTRMAQKLKIAIIGGSGFYQLDSLQGQALDRLIWLLAIKPFTQRISRDKRRKDHMSSSYSGDKLTLKWPEAKKGDLRFPTWFIVRHAFSQIQQGRHFAFLDMIFHNLCSFPAERKDSRMKANRKPYVLILPPCSALKWNFSLKDGKCWYLGEFWSRDLDKCLLF